MDIKLIFKKLNNTLTKEEEIILNEWLAESKDHQAYFDHIKSNKEASISETALENDWQKIEAKIRTKKSRNNYWKYAVAASILLVLSIAFFNKDIPEKEKFVTNESTILIGTDKARLTLEDGSNIDLEDGTSISTERFETDGKHLVYNSKNTSKSEEQFNFLTTPSGGEFNVELADGTFVWLNANSQLKYPVAFTKGATREVELIYGEAYFDVSPSTDHNGAKFLVKTQNQDIEVLGTEFNVKAYSEDKNIITTLVEGKVAILKEAQPVEELNPGEESVFDTSENSILKRESEYIEDVIAWKKGQFIFHKQPLEQIMTTLSRWYNIEVSFENEIKKDVKFSGSLNRKKHVFELLKNLEATGEVAFIIEDNKVSIK